MNLLKLIFNPKSRKAGNIDICLVCRSAFRLTPIEVRYYRQKEIPLPTTCRTCAAKARDYSISHPRAANE